MAKPQRQKRKAKSVGDGVEVIDIADLLPDPKNFRRHTPRNVGMITDALREVGTGRSGVIDEKGRVLAGNATLEALGEAGIRRVKVVDSSGEEWVVVRRKGLSEKQKKRLALYDNRTTELSIWNIDILKDLKDKNLLEGLFMDRELFSLNLGGEANDPNLHWQGMPECKNDDLSAWKSITINFNSAESMKAFAELIQQPLTENTRSIWYPAAEIGHYANKRYSSES